MPASDRQPESRLTAWVLAAPGAGDNQQLRALVELLGADARWIDQVDPVARVLRDRLAGLLASGVPSDKRMTYTTPWPDLVLVAGGRSVIDALRIRNASSGRSRVVCLGRPWAPLHWFDLIITSPQYRLPTADNVVMLDLPLNFPSCPPGHVLAQWRNEFDCLPRPLLGVLLGGDSGSYRFDDASAERLSDLVKKLVESAHGSAVVVGSPRTPVSAVKRLNECLDDRARLYPWAPEAPNPYASVLELADALMVTGDSASMLAEACHSGKPVTLFNPRERVRSRLNRRLRFAKSMPGRITQALTARGLWIPARDMPALHQRAKASGWLTDPELLFGASDSIAKPEPPLDMIRKRVKALVRRD